ncbi:MAG TPA: hypothetical protein VNQ79_28260 [Blastocatellia bacterium]|nr:hypothetical protein [Blastocatellia bacterium]
MVFTINGFPAGASGEVMSTQSAADKLILREHGPEPGVRQPDELDYRDVLALLAASPQQGVHLESLIADYGLTSPALRGRFFGYFGRPVNEGVRNFVQVRAVDVASLLQSGSLVD